MAKLTVVKKDGFFYLKNRDTLTPMLKSIKTMDEVKKLFKTDDIELISQTGKPYREVTVLDYDQYNLKIREDSTEKTIYLPLRSEKELIDYLIKAGKEEGYTETIVKLAKPIKGYGDDEVIKYEVSYNAEGFPEAKEEDNKILVCNLPRNADKGKVSDLLRQRAWNFGKEASINFVNEPKD